jgi:hypothetical protein
MSSLVVGKKVIVLPATSISYPVYKNVISNARAAGDLKFITKLDIRGAKEDTSYSVNYVSDTSVITTAQYSVPSDAFSPVSAYSEEDLIRLYGASYGYLYTAATAVLVRGSTLVYLSQDANSNLTLSEASASVLTGIAVNKTDKTITVSSAHSKDNVYDYLQWYQAQIANVALLPYGEIFSTIIGNNYTLKSDWSIVFSVAPTGTWNITASNITLSAELDLANFNLTGTLFFDVSGTYAISDSRINVVDTVDGDETVVINPTDSVITTNSDSANITINTPAVAITLTGLKIGTDVVILAAGTDTVLDSVDQTSGTTFAYTYTAQDAIDIGIIKPGYVTQYIYNLTPGATSANLPIVQQPDRNYL